MPPVKIGVELASLRLPLRQALFQAAQWGVDAVEIDARGEITPDQLTETAARQLRKMLDDLRLRVAAVGFHTRRGYETPEDLDARVDATRAAMRMAYALRAPVVVNRVGRLPADANSPEWRLLVDVLADLGTFGHHNGALFAAETGNESGADLARLLAALPSNAIGIDLNPGNLLLAGHSPLEAIEVLGPAILHVHATDAIRDPSGRSGEPAPLGQGSADLPAILGALDEHAYRGCFTIQHRTADDPQREIPQAIRYLRRL